MIILSDPFKGIFGEVTGFIFDNGNSFVKVNTEIGEKIIEPHSLKLISTIAQNCKKSKASQVDWQHYRKELAAKIAIAYAEKGRYEPEEIGAKAVEVANGVVEQLKESKV